MHAERRHRPASPNQNPDRVSGELRESQERILERLRSASPRAFLKELGNLQGVSVSEDLATILQRRIPRVLDGSLPIQGQQESQSSGVSSIETLLAQLHGRFSTADQAPSMGDVRHRLLMQLWESTPKETLLATPEFFQDVSTVAAKREELRRAAEQARQRLRERYGKGAGTRRSAIATDSEQGPVEPQAHDALGDLLPPLPQAEEAVRVRAIDQLFELDDLLPLVEAEEAAEPPTLDELLAMIDQRELAAAHDVVEPMNRVLRAHGDIQAEEWTEWRQQAKDADLSVDDFDVAPEHKALIQEMLTDDDGQVDIDGLVDHVFRVIHDAIQETDPELAAESPFAEMVAVTLDLVAAIPDAPADVELTELGVPDDAVYAESVIEAMRASRLDDFLDHNAQTLSKRPKVMMDIMDQLDAREATGLAEHLMDRYSYTITDSAVDQAYPWQIRMLTLVETYAPYSRRYGMVKEQMLLPTRRALILRSISHERVQLMDTEERDALPQLEWEGQMYYFDSSTDVENIFTASQPVFAINPDSGMWENWKIAIESDSVRWDVQSTVNRSLQ